MGKETFSISVASGESFSYQAKQWSPPMLKLSQGILSYLMKSAGIESI